MSQQERMATFGKLMGERKVTWQEYAFIVKQIPYSAARKESSTVRSNAREQRKGMVGHRGVDTDMERSEAIRPITQDAFVTGLERIDSGEVSRPTDEAVQQPDTATDDKIRDIAKMMASG